MESLKFHLVSETSMNIIFYSFFIPFFILITMKLKKTVFFRIFNLPNLFINLGRFISKTWKN